MTHTLKHYKIQADGSLRLVRTEIVADLPRATLNFSSLTVRDEIDKAHAERESEWFEDLVDAAQEG